MTKQQSGPSILRFLAVLFLQIYSSAVLLGQNPPSESATADFRALAKSAATAREAGRSDEAIRDYQNALKIRPDWQEGWWDLGTMQYDGNLYAEAAGSFKKLVQLAPSAGAAWSFLGLCEFETRDYASALSHLERAQMLSPGDDPEIARVSAYHLALLLNRTGQFERASALLSSVFGESQFSEQVKVALGLALLRVPLLPEEIDPSQDALVQAAGEAASVGARGDTARFADLLKALVIQYPAIPYLHYAYGNALAATGQPEEAVAEQRRETELSPQIALPFVQISALELALRRTQRALEAAEKAVQLAPESAVSHQALAGALGAAGRKEKAAEELRAADSLASEKPQVEERMVHLYANRGAPTVTSGAQHPTAGNDVAPADFSQLSRQAVASQAAGNLDDAMREYQQALQMRPDWNEGRWNLAMLYYTSRHFPQAIAALKTWVASKPGDGSAWAVMGLSEFEVKDYDNALLHLQRARELGFGGSREAVQAANYHLGILLIRSGQFDNASDMLAAEVGVPPLAKQIQFALGMALLRIAQLPEQVEVSKKPLVQAAGEISELLQSSRYDSAFVEFQALLKQYPNTPFLHYAYGVALASLSRYDDAEAEMHQELKISPQSELPYLRIAFIALRQHRPADALTSARSAVQLAPDSGQAHYLLGRAYLELGQEAAAVNELETASKITPNSPEVHFSLAKAYAKAKQPEKAEHERAIFVRLNALAEQQRGQHGSQSYEGPHDAGGFSAANGNEPQPH